MLIGGPTAAFVENMKEILDAEIILPEYSSVGNAAGALAAKGIRRFEVLIRPASMAAPDWEFLVFSECGKSNFHDYQEALDYAISLGETTVLSYMEDAGLGSDHIQIDVNKEEIIPMGWKHQWKQKLLYSCWKQEN